MTLPRCQVVHVWLKILDDAGLVDGHEVRSRVVELKRADSRVMGLKNGLEVEGQAIPECEFSARRAGQYPTRFGSPLFI